MDATGVYEWTQIAEGLWVDLRSNAVATCEPTPINGQVRQFVHFTPHGNQPAPLATVLSAASVILPDVPVIILPGRLLGGTAHSRVAVQTTDVAAGRIWRQAAARDA